MIFETTGMPHGQAVQGPPAIFTYFGQFIMHDLTRDDTPLSERHLPDPTDIVNHRTPFLDLDSVYGRGPGSIDDALYEGDGVSFRLGKVRNDQGELFDVPLDERTRRPLVADDRNGENLMIRQIHAMFLKLHNLAVVELRGQVPDHRLFEEARRRVQYQYQWLIRNPTDGYLIHVCRTDIYDELVARGGCRINWPNDFHIPTEFAHAVGRFGHSMVRSSYILKDRGVSLLEIFRAAHRKGPIDPEFAIKWKEFYDQGSNSIDTAVVPELFHLGPKSIQPFVERIGIFESFRLPVRTLYRHIRMRLPTGQQMRDLFDPTAVLADPPTIQFPDYNPYAALDALGLRELIPLWYYILLEAELNERGGNLGAIGSRVMCEVLEGALKASHYSIYKHICHDPLWRPCKWPSNHGPMEINNLVDLAIVVGLQE